MDKRNKDLQFIGKKIKKIRKSKKISQETLAYKANTSRNYMGCIERGEQNLGIRSLLKIAKALNVEPSELLPKLNEID